MEFSAPKPRRQSEPALPMINVVFLLLIFFLMSAQIAPPPPVRVAPPVAQGTARAAAALELYLAADGIPVLGDARGDAVWPALAANGGLGQATILIRADAGLDAAVLAAVLARLADLGAGEVLLATVPR